MTTQPPNWRVGRVSLGTRPFFVYRPHARGCKSLFHKDKRGRQVWFKCANAAAHVAGRLTMEEHSYAATETGLRDPRTDRAG